MKKTLIIISVFIISSISSFSQYFQDEEIKDTSLIKAWIVNDIEEYEGIYFFGISEYETTSTLSIDNKLVNFQIRNAGKEIYIKEAFYGWETNIENYTNVKIIGNKFISDQTEGEFVIYKHNGKDTKCLKLYSPPINVYQDNSELGTYSRNRKTTYISGKFPMTKFEILSLETLEQYKLSELKIMRNEIFARYGYKFKNGGQMEMYFNSQDWYHGEKDNVTNFLTSIEKQNIENIQKVEKTKAHNNV